MALQALGMLDYVRLLSLVLAASLMYAVQTAVFFTYTWFPFRGLLDWTFMRVKKIRENFSLHLGMDEEGGASVHTMDTPALVRHLGLQCEEHLVTTDDGFVLVLHRVLPRAGPAQGAARTPLLLQHGLMQDSEAWLTTGSRSLPVLLVEAGFDVFIGNNRGNKYSCKHLHHAPDSAEYWNFSLDDMARFDVPAMVAGILHVTQQPKLAYVGFSQGTAQMFAALAADPSLADRVVAFGALAAAVGVRGLAASALSSLVESDENFLYLLFGRGVMLSMSETWRRMLSPRRFMWLINQSLVFLFGWDMSRNMTYTDRLVSFAHIYSYCSVKAVVHWFQIIRARQFQMYTDPGTRGVSPRYDVSHLTVPTAVFLGGRDTVVDTVRTLKLLPPSAYVFFEPNYSHLDFKWARGAASPARAFESLLAFLHSHAPGAASAADPTAMQTRFGAHVPKLKRTPRRLVAAVRQYAQELAGQGVLVPAEAGTCEQEPGTPRHSRMHTSASLADVTGYVQDMVETFAGAPLPKPPLSDTSGSSDSDTLRVGGGDDGRRWGRPRRSSSESGVDAEDHAVAGFVSDALPAVSAWRYAA